MIDFASELTAWLDRPDVQVRLKQLMLEVLEEKFGGGGIEDDCLSPKAAAKFAGVSERTIRRWIKAGDIRSFGPGRLLRIRRSELEAFLESTGSEPADVIDIRKKARELVSGKG